MSEGSGTQGADASRRFSAQPFDVLMITNYDKGTSLFANPIEMESTSAYNPNFSFRMVGEQHYLSRIQTADYVYDFHLSESATLAAAVKPHDTVSVSVSGGSKSIVRPSGVRHAPPQPGRGADPKKRG
jgi:hypothetical protein